MHRFAVARKSLGCVRVQVVAFTPQSAILLRAIVPRTTYVTDPKLTPDFIAVLEFGNKLETRDISGGKGVDMFATMLSHAEDLLVVREQGASLPNLDRRGRYAPNNVRLVAQLEGERHEHFVGRVLARTTGSVGSAKQVRSAVVCLRAQATSDMVESRVRLLGGIASMLAPRPESELVILVPPGVSAAERIRLFELVEATLKAAPLQNVRLNFAPSSPAPIFSVQRDASCAQA